MAKFFSIPFAETGDKISPPNPTQADGTVSYAQGFGFDYQRKTDGTDPLAKVFPREQFNGIVNDITGAVGEIQLNGLAIWQDLTPKIPYPVGSLVRYNNKNWVSLVANNTVTPVEGVAWAEISANGYTKVQVDAKLLLKADKASSLAGYGITDAYTKTQVEALTAQATEISLGTAKIATLQQVNAGVADNVIVTPKKMRFGFSAQLSSVNGYLFLPTWLGGFCFMWGVFNVNKTTTTVDTVVAFPMAFPNSQFMAIVQSYQGVTSGSGMNDAVLSTSASGFTYRVTNTSGNYPAADFRYFCIGN